MVVKDLVGWIVYQYQQGGWWWCGVVVDQVGMEMQQKWQCQKNI